jgi:hypothetical protein
MPNDPTIEPISGDASVARFTAPPAAAHGDRGRSSRARSSDRAAHRGADELPVWLRRHRLEVLLWAFREGRPLDAIALTAVLGAKHERDDEPFFQWSRHSVRALLWCEISTWCARHELVTPPATASTMWTLLDHLAANDRFDPGSDPLSLLREPLVDSGGLDARGRVASRRRPAHPSLRGAPR